MGGLNVILTIILNFFTIQCCNLNNFGLSEYNFDAGVKSKRNSTLEKLTEEKINQQTTKTNLNYDSAKILILEMETESHEKQDKITITPEGLLGSLRKKNNPNDNCAYFGYKELGENVINYI